MHEVCIFIFGNTVLYSMLQKSMKYVFLFLKAVRGLLSLSQ